MAEFEDIKMVGMDESLTTRPKPEYTELYSLHFTLSAAAPSQWVEIANVQHLGRSWSTGGRRVQATSRHLIAECSLPEAQGIIDALKPIVEKVNQDYRQWLQTYQRKQQAHNEYERQQAEKRKETAGQLKFD